MQFTSFPDTRASYGQPRPDSTDFVHANGIAVQDLVDRVKQTPDTAQLLRLVDRVKQTPDTAQLLRLVEQARDQHLQLFHFAAAIGDRGFYGMMMTFLPLEAFVKELLVPNQNGSTAIDSARTMNSSLAIDIETFLFSHGVLLTENPLGFVVASSITSSTGLPSTGDPHLTRTEVGPSRYVICSNKASTVGLTLRANGIHFAATKAVYVQQVRSPIHAEKLLAFSESDKALSVAWSGCKIAVLAKEKSFRAAFKIFTPCKDADQQLAPGMSVLLDLENLSPPPSAETSLMVLRLYPSAGTVDSNTKTHHKATSSASGVRVADLGYRDEDFLKGFRRGWYKSDKYFRTVGDHPNRFLSGGDASNSYKFNIHERDDFGYDKKRVMIELPDEGVVFCRGIGDDPNNPEMACVLFDSTGNVRVRYAYRGKLGRWNDIVQ